MQTISTEARAKPPIQQSAPIKLGRVWHSSAGYHTGRVMPPSDRSDTMGVLT